MWRASRRPTITPILISERLVTLPERREATWRTPDVVVIGAGAAGLMAAFTAARRGSRVVVLDHAPEPGRKILISGGGRCNFTNRDVKPECFLSQNRHFARSALSRYTPADFLALLATHKIPWHEKAWPVVLRQLCQ